MICWLIKTLKHLLKICHYLANSRWKSLLVEREYHWKSWWVKEAWKLHSHSQGSSRWRVSRSVTIATLLPCRRLRSFHLKQKESLLPGDRRVVHIFIWSGLAVLRRGFCYCIFYCKYGHFVRQPYCPIFRCFCDRKTLNLLVIKEEVREDEWGTFIPFKYTFYIPVIHCKSKTWYMECHSLKLYHYICTERKKERRIIWAKKGYSCLSSQLTSRC